MAPIREAILILKEAEAGLRRLMRDQIGSGRYSDLATLASLADGVAGLIGGAGAEPLGSEPESAAPKSSSHSGVYSSSRRQGATGPRKRAPHAPARPLTKSKSGYPYFEVVDGWVGKVGWSKKNREEYRHYAPISAALSLAAHVDQTQEAGRVWMVEGLGDVANQETGESLPSYQIYLIIAWMRSAGLLAKQGRSGYVAVGGGRLAPGVNDALAANP